jgi:hypothetical protein
LFNSSVKLFVLAVDGVLTKPGNGSTIVQVTCPTGDNPLFRGVIVALTVNELAV